MIQMGALKHGKYLVRHKCCYGWLEKPGEEPEVKKENMRSIPKLLGSRCP